VVKWQSVELKSNSLALAEQWAYSTIASTRKQLNMVYTRFQPIVLNSYWYHNVVCLSTRPSLMLYTVAK